METKILSLVSILLVLFVTGIPARKAKKAWHPHSLNHHAKRTSEPVKPIVVPLPLCEEAGTNLDSFLVAKKVEWMNGPYPGIMIPMLEMMMDRTIEEFRGSDLFCALEGVGSIDELYRRLETANGEYYTFRAFRMAYFYVMIGLASMRDYSMRMLENPIIIPDYHDEEYYEACAEEVALVNHLQASGITELDPQGYQRMMDIIAAVNGAEWAASFTEHEPLSDLPHIAQCTRIANDYIKVWNRDPGADTYQRQYVWNMTGIDIPPGEPGHQVMKDTFCRIIGPSQLGDLYDRMTDMGILSPMFRFVYHHLMWYVDRIEAARPPHGDEAIVIRGMVLKLLGNLHWMGLLELE